MTNSWLVGYLLLVSSQGFEFRDCVGICAGSAPAHGCSSDTSVMGNYAMCNVLGQCFYLDTAPTALGEDECIYHSTSAAPTNEELYARANYSQCESRYEVLENKDVNGVTLQVPSPQAHGGSRGTCCYECYNHPDCHGFVVFDGWCYFKQNANQGNLVTIDGRELFRKTTPTPSYPPFPPFVVPPPSSPPPICPPLPANPPSLPPMPSFPPAPYHPPEPATPPNPPPSLPPPPPFPPPPLFPPFSPVAETFNVTMVIITTVSGTIILFSLCWIAITVPR